MIMLLYPSMFKEKKRVFNLNQVSKFFYRN